MAIGARDTVPFDDTARYGNGRQYPLVQAGPREKNPDPRDVRLSDGSPVHYALLDVPENGNVPNDMAKAAKAQVEQVLSQDENIVFACAGQTRERARQILLQALEQGN